MVIFDAMVTAAAILDGTVTAVVFLGAENHRDHRQ